MNVAKPKYKVHELSPDGYSRFFFITDILKKIYKDRKSELSILDVGGCSEFLTQQLDVSGLPYNLTVLDILDRPNSIPKKVKYIQSDATSMQIKDSAYDVVVSTDVLEHIFPEGKDKFVQECIRVTNQVLILAAPFDTPGVNEAEVVVNDFNKKLFGSGQNWLEEHLEYGKPKIDRVKRLLRTYPYDDFGTQSLPVWLLNTHVNIINAKLGLDKKKHTYLNQQYNTNILSMGETDGETYRHFFVVYKDKSLKGIFQPDEYKNTLDREKYSSYMSGMFSLMSDRIQQTKLESEKLLQRLDDLGRETQEKEALIDEQKRKLDRLEPIMKPIRLVRKYTNNLRGK